MSNKSVHMRIEFDGELAARMLTAFENDLAGRIGVLRSGIDASLKVIAGAAVATAPKPGSQGYTPRTGQRATKKMLHQTIGHKVAEYVGPVFGSRRPTILVGVVGPQYPAGAHGHLVEFSHRIAKGGTLRREFNSRWRKRGAPNSKRGFALTGAGRVVGRTRAIPFMQTAVEASKDKARQMMERAMVRYIGRRNG